MLKGFTFSNQTPADKLSEDRESISVAGMKWYPENDQIKLDIQLNFTKKSRERKPEYAAAIPEKLT